MTESNFTKDQWCDFIIQSLYVHTTKSITGYPKLFNEAKQELLSKGVIGTCLDFEGCLQLTEIGYKIIENMLSYEEWLNQNS